MLCKYFYEDVVSLYFNCHLLNETLANTAVVEICLLRSLYSQGVLDIPISVVILKNNSSFIFTCHHD